MNPPRPAQDDPPAALATDPAAGGLTAAEVADRVARGLVNRPPRSGWTAYRDIAVRNLFTLFNALVVPAAVLLFLLQDPRAAWAVSAMAVINTLIGLVQEVRAKRHLDQLALLAETRARVVRDGSVVAVPQGDVVRDDCVLLSAGDPVVADGTLLDAQFLEVDEALLTGESDPVPRRPGDSLLSGSFCVAGQGAYRAEGVGANAFAHRTAAEARRYSLSRSPLQRTIDLLIRVLTALTVLLCLGYVVLYFVRGLDLDDLVRMAAATVTSMVPQGLVLMTTLALTLGALRLSRQGAVVQRLPAVEAMAEVDVVCMDKTGTLTTSRLHLERIVTLDGGPAEESVRQSLRRFAWASLDTSNKTIQALRAALGEPPPGPCSILDQLPFKSQNRTSAVRLRTDECEETLVLGAFEVLVQGLPPAEAQRWERLWREWLATGLRLLLFARRDGAGDPAPLAELPLRPGLHALGLVALGDDLRPDAGDVLKALAGQGLSFKVISGDNPETVRATLVHVPLPAARQAVVTGDDWERAGGSAAFVREHAVFGRVSPQQKLAVITTLQGDGHRVAMIGDGVNDLLPIKRADLGIAMGEGSAATRTVAGLVLENNSFELLPRALDEGRTILRNVRRAAKLFLLKNVYTLVLIVAALGLFGLPFPYLPQQVTLLNTLTIGVPAFFIMLGRNPPGRPVHQGFLAEAGGFALGSGLATGLAGLGLWLDAARRHGEPEAVQRTLLLSFLVLLGLVNVLRLILDREAEPESADRGLKWWLAAALLLYLAAMYVRPVAYFFELTPLDAGQWLRVLAAWAAGLVLILTGSILVRRWRARR